MSVKKVISALCFWLSVNTLCYADNQRGLEHSDTLSLQLFFRRGHSDIDPLYMSNASRIVDFDEALDSILQLKGVRIDSVVLICSSASPEGPVALNERLSRSRAQSIETLFREKGLDGVRFQVYSVGEDWAELLKLIRQTDIKHKDEAINIIENTPKYIYKNGKIVGGRKKALMDMDGGEFWRIIDKRLFPYLRQATLSVYYNTDDISLVNLQVEGLDKPMLKSFPAEITSRPITLVSAYEKPIIALKTNLLYDAVSLVNLGLEVPLGSRFSLAADACFPWWQIKEKDITVQMLSAEIEGRYWFGDRISQKPLTGFFAGLYAGAGLFDFQLGKLSSGNGVQGDFFVMGGLSAGFAHQICPNLRFEYSLGLAYLRCDFREYISVKDTAYGDIKVIPYPWEIKRVSGVLPTRLSLSLIWMISSKRGGGK